MRLRIGRNASTNWLHADISGKGVTMHRCIAILGPAIRVSYRDPSIAILKKKKKKSFLKVTHGF